MTTVPAVRPEQTIRTGAYAVSAREMARGARGVLPAMAKAIVKVTFVWWTLRPAIRQLSNLRPRPRHQPASALLCR